MVGRVRHCDDTAGIWQKTKAMDIIWQKRGVPRVIEDSERTVIADNTSIREQ
jgi:hypothetical protein